MAKAGLDGGAPGLNTYVARSWVLPRNSTGEPLSDGCSPFFLAHVGLLYLRGGLVNQRP